MKNVYSIGSYFLFHIVLLSHFCKEKLRENCSRLWHRLKRLSWLLWDYTIWLKNAAERLISGHYRFENLIAWFVVEFCLPSSLTSLSKGSLSIYHLFTHFLKIIVIYAYFFLRNDAKNILVKIKVKFPQQPIFNLYRNRSTDFNALVFIQSNLDRKEVNIRLFTVS